MTNCLKKDHNKDPMFNAGVIFLRITVFFLMLTAVVVVYRFSYKPYPLKSEGLQRITVTSLEKTVRIVGYKGRRVSVRYHLKAVNEKTGHEYNQTITDSEYKTLEEGRTYTKTVFKTDGGRFISWAGIKDEKEAAKLYYSRFPDSEIMICRLLIKVLSALTLVNLGIGIYLIRRGSFNTRKSAAIKTAVSYEDILKAEHELERSK